MTYFGFLLLFLVIPILMLLVVVLATGRRTEGRPVFGSNRALGFAIAVQIVLAVTYTTPWDNYLVATGVWHYDPALVSGIVLGYVPLEEYIFFVLEGLLVGLWWRILSIRMIPAGRFRASRRIRIWLSTALVALWIASVLVLLSSWRGGTYLSLILVWALPPILSQFIFGADLLWHHRRLVTTAILSAGLYLSAADSLAIRAGTWTIDAGQITGVHIGPLPIEEGMFFFATVILLVFGMTLSLAPESRTRLASMWPKRQARDSDSEGKAINSR